MRRRQKVLFCYFFCLVAFFTLGSAEIVSFSSRNFSRSSKHDTFWHILATGYFYVLWTIAISDFRPLEIYKNLSFPCLLSLLQSTATQITISINIYIYIFFKYYAVWNQFLVIKIHVKVFYIPENLQKKTIFRKK